MWVQPAAAPEADQAPPPWGPHPRGDPPAAPQRPAPVPATGGADEDRPQWQTPAAPDEGMECRVFIPYRGNFHEIKHNGIIKISSFRGKCLLEEVWFFMHLDVFICGL